MEKASRIWGICCLFNPQNSPRKVRNYRLFRTPLRRQGLPLLTVELAFGRAPFALTPDDAEILIQVRADSVLWQKERLLNIGLARLPPSCDQVVWLDADILFENDAWVAETSRLLEQYNAVQPYEFGIRLPQDRLISDPRNMAVGDAVGEKQPSAAMAKVTGHPYHTPHTGFAWAVRRAILDSAGFYDRFILGSGDAVISHALCATGCRIFRALPIYLHTTPALRADIEQWQNKIAARADGRVSYTPGNVLSLYHGSRRNRRYIARHRIFEKVDFDPASDLKINADGCWEWASEKPALHRFARDYFWLRNEDGLWLREAYILALTWHRLLAGFLWSAAKSFALRFEIIRKNKQAIKRAFRMSDDKAPPNPDCLR